MMRPGFFAAVLLALASAAWASPALAAGVREAGSWIGVCDNLRTCSAFGFAAPGPGRERVYVKLVRRGEAGADPWIQIASDESMVGESWSVLVDGKAVPHLTRHKIVVDFCFEDCSSPRISLDGRQARSWLERVRAGSVLEVRQGRGRTFRFPLEGLGEVLAWLDAEQHRTGSRTALWEPGRAEEAVPPLPSKPVIELAPLADQTGAPYVVPQAVLDRIGPVDCPGIDRRGLIGIGDRIHGRLAPGVLLWAPLCDMGDVSQGRHVFLSDEDGGDLREISLPPPPGVDAASFRPILQGWGIDARFLFASPEPRACGRRIAWAWTDTGFQVIHAFYDFGCRGVPNDEEPSIYLTDTRDPSPRPTNLT